MTDKLKSLKHYVKEIPTGIEYIAENLVLDRKNGISRIKFKYAYAEAFKKQLEQDGKVLKITAEIVDVPKGYKKAY